MANGWNGTFNGLQTSEIARVSEGNIHSRRESEWSQLHRALRVQVTVIRAFVLREARTRFGRHYGGYIWAFLQPCIHMGAWFLIFLLFRHGSFVHDMHPLLFLATGLIPFFLFWKVSGFIRGSLGSNRSLLQFPLAKQIDTVLARFILESMTMILVGCGILGTLILMGYATWPESPVGIFVATAILLSLALGFGFFRCTLTLCAPLVDKFDPVINRLLYFTSGVFFSIDKMPTPVQNWLEWNPVLHGVELFRSAWSFTFESQVATIWYPMAVAAALFLGGLLMERRTRRLLKE